MKIVVTVQFDKKDVVITRLMEAYNRMQSFDPSLGKPDDKFSRIRNTLKHSPMMDISDTPMFLEHLESMVKTALEKYEEQKGHFADSIRQAAHNLRDASKEFEEKMNSFGAGENDEEQATEAWISMKNFRTKMAQVHERDPLSDTQLRHIKELFSA